MKTEEIKDVDTYISGFPKETQLLLETLRTLIRRAAPKAEEIISYKMPAYKLGTMLVFFAGYKNHIGFYPSGSGIASFQKELAPYKHSKGAVQFSLNSPLPIRLINKIVKLRVKENLEKIKLQQEKKKKK